MFSFSILSACTRVRKVTFDSKVPYYLFNWKRTTCKVKPVYNIVIVYVFGKGIDEMHVPKFNFE